jgi:hypothetical protein
MADNERAIKRIGRRAKGKKVRTHPRAHGFNEGSVETRHPGVKRPKPPKPATSPAHGKKTGPHPSASAMAHASDRARFKRPVSTTATPTSPARPRGQRPVPSPAPSFDKGARRHPGTPAPKASPAGRRHPSSPSRTPSTPRFGIPESGASMPKPVALPGGSSTVGVRPITRTPGAGSAPKPSRAGGSPVSMPGKVAGKSAFAPGQIKKRTGAKSAAAFTRGQSKSRGG